MNRNLSAIERIIRFVIGVFLMTWAFAGGPGWTYVGLFFLFTASFGSCPVYWALKINFRS